MKTSLQKILNAILIASIASLALLISSCATNKNQQMNAEKKPLPSNAKKVDNNDLFEDEQPIIIDPYEKFNRKMYAFNTALDKAIIRPIAIGYDFIMPDPLQKGVTNAFSNIGEVPNIANDVLQANPKWFLIDAWRLIINTTAGIAGLFDVASSMGLPKHKQTFGITLAKWGYKNSNFLMLPFFGPSTVRDAISFPVNYYTNVINYVEPRQDSYAITAWQLINTRSNLLLTDNIIKQAFDPYVFIRDAYLQNINYRIDPERTTYYHSYDFK